MNLALPPVIFPEPQIKRRRRERVGFSPPPAIPAEQRRAIATAIHRNIQTLTSGLRTLSPEAKRAIFLKLTHDRPLTQADLAGTGLIMLSRSNETESLVVPRKPADFSKLESRIQTFAAGDEPSRPAGTEFATSVKRIEVADPKSRLSEGLARSYRELISQDFIKYEIEVMSFALQAQPARREINAIIEEIHRSLGNGVHGHIYEHEIFGRGARVLLGTTGGKFREFVESPEWGRKILLFDERPKFETFNQVLDNFPSLTSQFLRPLRTLKQFA